MGPSRMVGGAGPDLTGHLHPTPLTSGGWPTISGEYPGFGEEMGVYSTPAFPHSLEFPQKFGGASVSPCTWVPGDAPERHVSRSQAVPYPCRRSGCCGSSGRSWGG